MDNIYDLAKHIVSYIYSDKEMTGDELIAHLEEIEDAINDYYHDSRK